MDTSAILFDKALKCNISDCGDVQNHIVNPNYSHLPMRMTDSTTTGKVVAKEMKKIVITTYY